ncbi:Erythromycin esterase homolog [Hymenobacter daecheongensis DSM 21074]|uniref:Erythromycin esterase homolog n=1 Tax=Hymenobacter daecheongensis DSM 21074 TaxID=1121955 RepID=A0A1M6LHK5_9BACT|nr:erythromycin esterase family protein [Hymenobacter daecheongensis]SHJ70671.1 Erythromycin esterase homolog [Hymenobacter daecheongensis DSM 21074]
MSLLSRLLTAGLLGCALAASAQTTTPKLVVHPVRSISAADTSFADLEFLTQEIGGARVVLLGEPSHGEGNVFEAKARLVRFLQQRMSFTTLAFESGFYEVNKAQQQLEAGVPAREALGSSVFGIWAATQEFEPVEKLVAAHQLRVTGFDPQLTGTYGEELVDDLEVFLEPQKASAAINYDYLDEVLGFMQHFNGFPAGHTLGEWERNVKLADRLLAKAGTTPARRAAAEHWQQTLRSLQALARDYVQNDPSVKDHQTFQARDNNPRDAQMADNLLWYLRQHPQEKVICWGATAHFANQTQLIDNVEIQQFRPMGWHVKNALGAQAYILGTATAGGTYAAVGETARPIASPPAGTLEARLDSLGADYLFLNLKQNFGSRRFPAYSIMEYTPLVAEWAQVVDGVLFLKATRPPHPRVQSSAGLAAVSDSVGPAARAAAGKAAASTPGLMLRRAAPAAGNLTVRGRVTDRKTRAAVPFASVALPALGLGVMADANGSFTLAVPRTALGAVLQVSSMGYGAATAAVGPQPLAVALEPQAYALGDVRVSGESLNPRKIMKKVLAAAPANYEQNDYLAQVYTRRQLSNFDTLRHAVEYVSQIFEPAGYRHWGGGFMMLGPIQKHRVQELNVLVQSPRPLGPFDLGGGGQGFFTASADPVRISPLFKSRTLGKFVLRLDSVLQQGDETTYIIGFTAKRANHRTTGTYLQAGYSGRVYIRQQDHAVLRYEALWQADTVQMNETARKYFGRQNLTARLYSSVYSDGRTSHVVTYQRAATGRYHVATSVARAVSVGRVLGKAPFFSQTSCEEHFTMLPAGAPPLPNPELDPRFAGHETYQLDFVKPCPEFWQTYQRPAPAAPAPVLNAKQP